MIMMKDCKNCRHIRTNSRCFYCVIKSNSEPSEWCPDMEDTLRRYCENDVKNFNDSNVEYPIWISVKTESVM